MVAQRSAFLQTFSQLSMGAFDAKTHFSALLRRVEDGAVVTITRNGHDVAVMQSPALVRNSEALDAWSRLTAMAQAISAQNNADSVTVNDILEWKNDGRR